MGTTGGMSRFDGRTFKNYKRADGLPHNLVRAINFDEDGAAWIGTYGGGLARLKNERFTVFDTRNGLIENIVSRILDDTEGNL